MSEQLLQREINEGVCTLTINRIEKYNAINFGLINEFNQALEQMRTNDDVKMIVIRGAGEKAFCSGGDLSEFHALKTEVEAYSMLSQMGDVLYKLATFPKPTIAYVNGIAIGGGCEIAAACDIRIAHERAKMGFVQGNQGITTGWGGGTLLMERISPAQGFQLLWSASILPATEAKDAGYISEIIKEDSELNAILQTFKEKQSGVLQAYKQMLVRKWNMTDLKKRMEEEIRLCAKLWESDEHHEAVAQFRNRRK
ncbi:enoyl-CoA hydratase/isomerase family protein [Bacillus massiliigorillae]|uniref:enoyl-CoA hydratase/isomerase family protein n=1 Tax=Bacillus massiliigorillae TaxID=1243664 RepID=UPI0003A53367|nr:enoyl-CoA hydratase/isomerase family protein [Bacillus massiliigorillae]